jgi:hypothetical protein
MPTHSEAIARRMTTRLSPRPDADVPSSPTDETTDESAAGDGPLSGTDEQVLAYGAVVASVAVQAWAIYAGLDPKLTSRRLIAKQKGDMPTLQRETARLKQLLLRRLQAEAVTPPDLPEGARSRILDAAAEETLAEGV